MKIGVVFCTYLDTAGDNYNMGNLRERYYFADTGVVRVILKLINK
jgi:hypothetical protein